MPHPTEGSEALGRYAKKHTQKITAERIGKKLGRKLSQATVSAWVIARQTPAGDAMVAMEDLGIARIRQWLKPARAERPAEKRAS